MFIINMAEWTIANGLLSTNEGERKKVHLKLIYYDGGFVPHFISHIPAVLLTIKPRAS